MQNNTLITLVVTLIIAGGGGYLVGKGAGGDTTDAKSLQASVAMMNEQAVSIQQMGEMMQSNGLMMQELGVTYKDEKLVSSGKDLEVVGANHMKANQEASHADDGMGHMMGN